MTKNGPKGSFLKCGSIFNASDFTSPYARHHNLLLIRNRSGIIIIRLIHKVLILRKKTLNNIVLGSQNVGLKYTSLGLWRAYSTAK